jgi:hypothetical protein
MISRLKNKAQALRMWLALKPTLNDSYHRLAAAGYDPEAVLKEIDAIQLELLLQLSQTSLMEEDDETEQ